MTRMEEHRQLRLSAVPLLLLAAVDLVLALVLLAGSGLSRGFFGFFAFGAVLAAIGLVQLYRTPRE